MNRVALVLHTPAVRLSVFDHPSGEAHTDPPAEEASCDAVHFVEAGTFAIRPDDPRARSGAWAFGPGMLFVTPRALAFTCRHDVECPDDRCFSVAYTADAVEQLRGAGLPALRAGAIHATPRQRFLRYRLRTCHPGDALRAELLAGAVFESLADDAPARAPGTYRDTPDLLRRVARAAELAEAAYARPLALTELAGAAGMSPYHFARVFSRLAGVPPHRYLTAVRLRVAAHRLTLGDRVTAASHAAGFASLSHFVTAFRRRFGVTPSAFARGLRRPVLRAALAAPVWGRAPGRSRA